MKDRAKIKQADGVLQKYIDNKSFLKIYRTICGEEENLDGFLLGMSKDFLFLQLGYSFEFDGYAIIRKEDVERIRHSSYERTQRKIFKAEGVLERMYGFDKYLPLSSWAGILKALKKHDFHVIVENIRKDYLDFWIGEIIKVTDRSLSIHNYDPNGKLDDKPNLIRLETIRNIKFGDNYSTVFRKYLQTKRK